MAADKKLRSSKKHPVLEYIFKKYYNPKNPQKVITFYLSDITDGYNFCKTPKPVSISNTILDLTRQDRGIDSRLPKSISGLGYDLRKKTGQDSNGKKFAGEFVFVGIGNVLNSWLVWPDKMPEITLSSAQIPKIVLDFIRPDESGLFSIIDYLDIFSRIFFRGKTKVFRVQNPMKWQPNEIDGCYIAEFENKVYLFEIEAKSLVTHDEINIDQLTGGFLTTSKKMKEEKKTVIIQPVAVKMIQNGIDIAIFPEDASPIKPKSFYRIKFNPPIKNWT